MGLLSKTLSLLKNVLVPEEDDLQELLSIGAAGLRRLLPRAEGTGDLDTISIFSYRHKKVRRIVWQIKYKAHPELLSLLAQILYEEILDLAQEKAVFQGKTGIGLIPIPASPRAERERGYNQCLLLAEEIRKLDKINIKVFPILHKIKETEHQTKLNRKERLLNMKNCFALKNIENSKLETRLNDQVGQVANFLPIIIDDVCTTGATIEEARRALAEAGMEEVLAVTIAH